MAEMGPCKNPNCKSYGKVHPNCKCYSGGGAEYSEGGFVCNGAHETKCINFADGGTVTENTLIHNNPSHAIEHVIAHKGLHHVLTKMGHSKSPDHGKVFEEYVDSAKRAHKTVKGHMGDLFGPNKVPVQKGHQQPLKEHLQLLREHPEKMMEIGGNLGDHLPDQGALVAAKAASAVGYLNSLKPMKHQGSPLDTPADADPASEAQYDRHLGLAENPMSIINHVKDGTIQPSDITTMKTIYPNLYQTMIDQGFEKLVDHKTSGKNIPYHQKQGLSLLLGQPLDSSMSPASMQAIIKSQGPQQANLQAKASPKKKASGVELGQINKVNSMDDTVLQDRMKDKLAKD